MLGGLETAAGVVDIADREDHMREEEGQEGADVALEGLGTAEGVVYVAGREQHVREEEELMVYGQTAAAGRRSSRSVSCGLLAWLAVVVADGRRAW